MMTAQANLDPSCVLNTIDSSLTVLSNGRCAINFVDYSCLAIH